MAWRAQMLLGASLAIAVPSAGGERLELYLGAAEGLGVDRVHEVAFDEDGYLWAATPIGVVRFDGLRFEQAAPDDPPHAYFSVVPKRGGGLWVRDRARHLFELQDGQMRPIEAPPGADYVSVISVDDRGALWALRRGEVFRRADDGSWARRLDGLMVDGERAVSAALRGDHLVVTTTAGVLAVHDDQAERWLLREPREALAAAARQPDGSLLVLALNGALEHWQDGHRTLLADPSARGVSLLGRGEATWVSWDRHQARVVGKRTETWDDEDGGWYSLSPDGAMVTGSSRGLTLLPEPDTVTLGTNDGLPSNAVRFVREGAGKVWISTWHGAAVYDEGTFTKAEVATGVPRLRGLVCPDDTGTGWTIGAIETHSPPPQVLTAWRPGETPVSIEGATGYGRCVNAPDGTVWVALGEQLWQAHGTRAQRVTNLPAGTRLLRIDRLDRMWAYDDHQLCHAPVRGLSADTNWRCTPLELPGLEDISGLYAIDESTALVASRGLGLLRLAHGQVSQHPASDPVLGTRDLNGISPSPRGGVWVFGTGVFARLDSTDLSELERLGAWAGVRQRSAAEVLETEQGVVYIGGGLGVVRVPDTARQRPTTAPAVHLAERLVNGAASVGLVPAAPNQIELQFASLAFRDRGEVRYRVSVDGGPHQLLPSGNLVLVDMQSGDHHVVYQASRDGVAWSPPQTVAFSVATPWFRSWWFLSLVGVAVAALLVAAYRARVALLVARERDRTVIAMDLHDQLGSGLGSIQLIASVLDRSDLSQDARHDLTQRIRSTATELHGGLQGLVSSLRPGGATVGALLDRLRERARDLLPDPDIDVRVVVPTEHAATVLSLAVCRELERIAAEALHNAARHGHARSVRVDLQPGPNWALSITDDGVGFDVNTHASGLGLASMRDRAARIGGIAHVRSEPGQGTTVRIAFQPGARARRKGGRT